MIFSGIQLVNGSEVTPSLAVSYGPALPGVGNSTVVPTLGQLFYQDAPFPSGNGTIYPIGLYICVGFDGTGAPIWQQQLNTTTQVANQLPTVIDVSTHLVPALDVNGNPIVDTNGNPVMINNPGADGVTKTFTKVIVDSKGLVIGGTAYSPTTVAQTLADYGIINAQTKDDDLTAIAAIADSSTGYLKKTAANTWVLDNNIFLTANSTVNVSGDVYGTGNIANGVSVQLSPTGVHHGYYGTGNQVASFFVDDKGRITSAGNVTINIDASQIVTGQLDQSLISAASIMQYQGNVSVLESQVVDGTLLARLADNEIVTGDWSYTKPITGVMSGASISQLTTKEYVDNVAAGINPQTAVKVTTTTNIAIAGSQTIDGIAVVPGDRVLVKDQTFGAQNGVYIVANGVWTRAAEFDGMANGLPANEVSTGDLVYVSFGTVNGNSSWVLTTTGTITVGITVQQWSVFSRPGDFVAGAGLTLSGHTFDINSASASRIVVNPDNIDLALTGVSPFIPIFVAKPPTGSTTFTSTKQTTKFSQFDVDVWGRIVGTSSTQEWLQITNTPTTRDGYGITDAQPLSANLDALAYSATTGIYIKTGTGASTTRSVVVTAGTGLTVSNGDGILGNITLGTNATSASTPSTLVMRDNNNDFVSNNITAVRFIGLADRATKLETARTISVGTDVSGSVSFDGTGSVTVPVTLNTVNATVGTYGSATVVPVITVNAKGLVTSVTTGTITTNAATATIVNDTAASSIVYPLWTNGTGAQAIAITNNSLTFQPSTGFLSATKFIGSGATLTNIPNAGLVNSSLTIGTTNIALGGSSTVLAGLSAVTSTLFTGALTGAASLNVLKTGDTMSGDLTLNNAVYNISKNPSGTNVRMLGINATNIAYVGPIDAGPVSTIINGSSTSTVLSLYTSGTEKIRIDGTGNVFPGSTNTQALGSVSAQWTNVYAGNFTTTGSLTSTVATGTPPLYVTSTTKVANLNADLLDGMNTSTANAPNTILYRDINGDAALHDLTVNSINGVAFNSITGLSTTLPLVDAPAASAGTAVTVSRSDHVHPTDTTRGAVASPLNQFAATTSAQLASIITDETGTGSLVFSNSPTLVTPNLGKPSYIDISNATGTATITSTNVITNANLTGPITSVGNATAIASQTGTGTTFVVQTSPTLITPNIGSATGTALTTTSGLTSNNSVFAKSASGSTGYIAMQIGNTTNSGYLEFWSPAASSIRQGYIGYVTGQNAQDAGTISYVAGGHSFSGPVTLGSNLTVNGNFTVNGTVTTINAATLDVVDLNITVGKNAINASQANGAGITAGTYIGNATILYNSTNDSWSLNKRVDAVSFYGSGAGLTGTASSLAVGSAGTAGTVTTAAQTAITSVGTLTGLTVSGATTVYSLTVSGDTNVAAGVASSGIQYYGSGIAHANIAWLPNSKTFNFRTGNGATATADTWGAANISASGQITGSQFNGSGAGLTGIGASFTAGAANSVTWTNVSGKPINVSYLINDSGYITASASITGTATSISATRATWPSAGSVTAVVGQLAWQNYGSNHTIFDASASVAPDGSSHNNTNSEIAWSATYPTLMGYNGANTYGVRVDSSRAADYASNSGTTNQRTFGNVRTDGINRGSYGSISVAGNTNGYSGIDFTDNNLTWMGSTGAGVAMGAYKTNSSWAFYFDLNGVLQTGTVPWTSVNGRPTNVSSFSNDSGYITSGGRAYPRRSDGGDLNFYWSGQSGQPTWLWGGTDGVNMYVYNPSNFSVNYASTAGSATTAGSTSVLTGSAHTNGTDGWFRTTGDAGWYNDSWSTGIFSNSAGLVQTYNASNFKSNGTILAVGDVTAFSDERLKTNWQDLPVNFVDSLADVKVGIYDRIDIDATQVGVSAQSLQAVMPDAVTADSNDLLSVAYGNAALAACVMLAKEVRELKAEIAILKAGK